MGDKNDLESILGSFLFAEPRPVLFAGAGVANKASLPTWRDYLTQLAELARPDDPMTRHHMAERLGEYDLIGAADIYFLSRKIPAAEKYQNLVKPLRDYDVSALVPLLSLPFASVVTTNYDRSLLTGYARAQTDAPEEVNLGDPTLAAAPFNKSPYIARIHGRVEVPETIQLNQQHYDALAKDTHYQDFLAHLFTRTRLLFLGFSFLDPAIQSVLELVERKVGKYHDGRHLALVPNDSTGEFIARLDRFSIKAVKYAGENAHDALWTAVKRLANKASGSRKEDPPQSTSDPFSATRRFLSACYARSSLGARMLPLRNAVIEGIVSACIAAGGKAGTSDAELRSAVANELTLTPTDAKPLVDAALLALAKDGLVAVSQAEESGPIYVSQGDESLLDVNLSTLVSGAVDRYVVRSGGKDRVEVRDCLNRLFRYLVAQRGWDLGAAFASGRVPDQLAISPMMLSAPECAAPLAKHERLGLARAVENLLQRPNGAESAVLAELGRISFALELVTRTARDTLFHKLTLPERVYLDANVLMPSLAPGHPYHDIYQKTISQLVSAATSALSTVEIIAYRGFLNEIVSHRRLAIEAMENLSKDAVAALRKEALLYGTVNMNVYVAAFANTLATQRDLTFTQYLEQHAPYRTESELVRWLRGRGIAVRDDVDMRANASRLSEILHLLERSNADGSGLFRKQETLILHDAVQVSALARDLENGVRAVFVSADRKLKENLVEQGLSSLASAMMSHVGLAQLVDLLVGSAGPTRGLATMFWGSKVSDETEQVRNYLIDLALDHYHEGYAMEMGTIVDDMAEDAVSEVHRRDLRLDAKDPKRRAEVMAVLDGFEEKYFAKLREVIEAKERELGERK